MRATKWQQRWPISCLASSFTFLLFNAVSLWKRGYTLRCHCDQARMCHADCALLSYNSLSSSYILIAFAALFSFLLFFTVSFIALTGINGLDCTGLGLARTRAHHHNNNNKLYFVFTFANDVFSCSRWRCLLVLLLSARQEHKWHCLWVALMRPVSTTGQLVVTPRSFTHSISRG